ncbi:putative restriction endonuclease [Pustulibacterium marinum]|uniref:Putative restriction endonuclease n=1 Tax=Pustulibacterium marinum TaxID=1224947 RepID=A0A1I7F2Z1_9FLAO|nr:HNH endonuclease [Pustulibacterium marinum]SFU30465.1 putative restriction endonuclease [Pustulibacterium marinum]
MNQQLAKYTKYFQTLKQGYSKGLGKAPHKPVLLLSVIQLIQNGSIRSPKVYVSPELVTAFQTNWEALVITAHIPTFSLPFFHLKNEKGDFWNLVTWNGLDKLTTTSRSIKSFKMLEEEVRYAELAPDLFQLLTNPVHAAYLTEVLLATYFPATKQAYDAEGLEKRYTQLADEMLQEPAETYQTKMKWFQEKPSKEIYQIERYVRSDVFKKTIPKLYQHRCCISGMQVQTGLPIQMVDACHIIPFKTSLDDTVTNGFSLSPTLHRAFDRGLIGVDDDYRVIVSPVVTEQPSVYAISQFQGAELLLPKEPAYHPSQAAFAWHRSQVFVKGKR